ncbi:hypothetical protein PHPALM_28673 [Phytophthora palmivora]|uniref:Uncharacterized protein n=1 Tax=Phytophthora palmivora TaxID=4796 RepID=A0A2P4X9H0_9STRA|nr:hypothetical protein PHPALM_28673 [Phytophthora palmivora]
MQPQIDRRGWRTGGTQVKKPRCDQTRRTCESIEETGPVIAPCLGDPPGRKGYRWKDPISVEAPLKPDVKFTVQAAGDTEQKDNQLLAANSWVTRRSSRVGYYRRSADFILWFVYTMGETSFSLAIGDVSTNSEKTADINKLLM